MTGDQHERDQDQDPADAAGEAADLLDALRAAVDPPDRHDMAGKRANWRLRRAAELARERAAELAERPDDEADRGE